MEGIQELDRRQSYSEIECNFCAWLFNLGEEAGLFIGCEFVGQGSCRSKGGKGG